MAADSPEAHEPRSGLVCEQDGTAVRYELRVRMATRYPRSQMVIWCYDDKTAGIALIPAGGDVERIRRWNRP